MNTILRSLVTIISIVASVLMAAPARASTHSLNEDAALNLLLRTLKQDRVYAKRISVDCITFDTEEKMPTYFQFALRENHTANCGGDPDISPVIDRYRVYRSAGKIQWFNAAQDNWQRYNAKQIR